MEEEMTYSCPLCHSQVSHLEGFNICDQCADSLGMINNISTDIPEEVVPLSNKEDQFQHIDAEPPKDASYTIKRSISSYYDSLNEWVDEIEAINSGEINFTAEEKEEVGPLVNFSTYLSFGLNCFLMLLKAHALKLSGSYTLLSSLSDSCLDLVAGIIISATATISKTKPSDYKQYPLGKSLISTLGILTFSILMSICAIFIIWECIDSLIKQEHAAKLTHHAVHTLRITIGLKFCMWGFFTWIGHPITLTLAEDHRNDVFTNLFGLLMYYGGSTIAWWLDSTGGLIISLFVLSSWSSKAFECYEMLVGQTSNSMKRKVVYLASHHSSKIKSVEQVMAVQFATKYLIEVHVIIDGNLPFKSVSAIGQSLQERLEKLDGVQKAYVHLDYLPHNNDEHILDVQIKASC